jgi:glucose-1-phosphate cytidylyltransferase
MNTSEVPVFILAGGLGMRLKEHTEYRPKPMVEIGGKPILWHIMGHYNRFGFKRFVICTGFRQEVIKQYFLSYYALNSDFTTKLRENDIVYHDAHHEEDWEVTVAYTGALTMTGGRIGRAVVNYLGDAEHFAVTYGDGLTDADLGAELEHHLTHGRTGTVLAVNPLSRFGELKVDENDAVIEFAEKPGLSSSWINGGYFFFRRGFTDYLTTDEGLVLEKEPLMRLSRNRELRLFRHTGFWACMDTQRDKEYLEELLASGRAPWVK